MNQTEFQPLIDNDKTIGYLRIIYLNKWLEAESITWTADLMSNTICCVDIISPNMAKKNISQQEGVNCMRNLKLYLCRYY